MKTVATLRAMRDRLTVAAMLVETGMAAYLLEHDSATTRDLAEELDVAIAAMEMRVVKAARAGLLDRGLPAGKQRQFHYWLSDHARRILE